MIISLSYLPPSEALKLAGGGGGRAILSIAITSSCSGVKDQKCDLHKGSTNITSLGGTGGGGSSRLRSSTVLLPARGRVSS